MCYVPFIQPNHAAPDDYLCWTVMGVKEAFRDFNSVDVGVGAGPTSAWLWVTQEWLSLLLSFGSSKLKDVIFLLLMVLTFPLKWIDFLLQWHKDAEKLASGLYVHAKK